jgi:hypothetical protein
MTVFASTQIMFGKHPRISQTLCITAPLDALSPLPPADQQVLPDPRYPAALFLSISGRSL